ncbi:hypothetical protein XENTR_v10018039 [Xenopus tropicalis]|nr:hypothetical protein XENTR_v10018039 [Xenopus tropicalis]
MMSGHYRRAVSMWGRPSPATPWYPTLWKFGELSATSPGRYLNRFPKRRPPPPTSSAGGKKKVNRTFNLPHYPMGVRPHWEKYTNITTDATRSSQCLFPFAQPLRSLIIYLVFLNCCPSLPLAAMTVTSGNCPWFFRQT